MNFAQFAAEEGFNRLTHAEDALAEETLVEELDRHIAYNKAHPISSEWKQDAQALGRGDLDPCMNARKAMETVTNARAIRRAYETVDVSVERMKQKARNYITSKYAVDFAALRREVLGR